MYVINRMQPLSQHSPCMDELQPTDEQPRLDVQLTDEIVAPSSEEFKLACVVGKQQAATVECHLAGGAVTDDGQQSVEFITASIIL